MQNILTLIFFFVIIKILIEFIKPKKKSRRNYRKKTETKNDKEKLVFVGIVFFIILSIIIINYIIKIGKYVSENIAEISIILFIIGAMIFSIIFLIKIFFQAEYENIKSILKNILTTIKPKVNQNYTNEALKTFSDVKKNQPNTHSNSSYSYIPKEEVKKSNVQKGKEYEEQIGKYYESIGYHVIYHGFIKGKRDKGIDLIATKENETLLIQCKNWQNSKVKQKDLKEFFGNCSLYLERNHIRTLEVKKLFITSNENIDYGVTKFMQENYQSMEYKIVPYME